MVGIYIAWLALEFNDTLLLYQIHLADLFNEEFDLAMDMIINCTQYSRDMVPQTLIGSRIRAT
jgi:hypothetical protein